MMEEEWRDIKGYEGRYQASSIGRIKSLERDIAQKSGFRTLKERILKQNLDKHGYFMVNLYINGKSKKFRVHQLIAIAFLGHIPCGHEKVINHISGDRLNNNVDNLEIVTHRENLSTCFREKNETYTSKYVGVHWDNSRNKWVASIRVKGIAINLGRFDIEIDAHNKHQEAVSNLDNDEYWVDRKPKYSSIHKYILFDKQKQKWRVWLPVGVKTKHIGFYNTEELAYEAQQQYLKDNDICMT